MVSRAADVVFVRVRAVLDGRQHAPADGQDTASGRRTGATDDAGTAGETDDDTGPGVDADTTENLEGVAQ